MEYQEDEDVEDESCCKFVAIAISLPLPLRLGLLVVKEGRGSGADSAVVAPLVFVAAVDANAPTVICGADDDDDDEICSDNGWCSSDNRLRILSELTLADDVFI